MADEGKSKRAIDSINTLPDVILQHILCFIPTRTAISTSLLSRRWRHVWCDIPSLSLNADTISAASVTETLTRYTAPKMIKLKLTTTVKDIPHIDRWIKCAMSHNVENLSLDMMWRPSTDMYKLPDFFYINPYVKILKLDLGPSNTIFPEFSVSWTSLKKLLLGSCVLCDESMAKILSGCPLLESLTLYLCYELKVLDLSKSMRLRTLNIDRDTWVPGPTHIVAPHIHSLVLITSQLSCSLVDVASLNEAKIDICFVSMDELDAGFLQIMVLKMLEKLQNVEKLTFGGNFIQILSLAEIRGVPFPIFKVKDLTIQTEILQYVIPGMERLLQNSPDLEKLTIRGSGRNTLPGKHINQYLTSQGLNSDQCWRPKHGVSWDSSGWGLTLEHVASLVEIVLKNANKLEKMVLVLYEHYLTFSIKEVVPTLPLNTNVTIVLSSTNQQITSEYWYDW